MEPFFTVGHSTRPIDEFISLLQPNGVTRIVDVRSFPRSRTNPQYNVDVLPHTLRVHGIGYEHVKALGGKRPRQKDVPEDLNAFWMSRASATTPTTRSETNSVPASSSCWKRAIASVSR